MSKTGKMFGNLRTSQLENCCLSCRWLFWGFFCTYLVIGGYFNLLIHCINNHRWRFSFQAQMVSLGQAAISTGFVLLAFIVPVGAYAWQRGSWTAAWFSVVIFVLLSLELTMVGCLAGRPKKYRSPSVLSRNP